MKLSTTQKLYKSVIGDEINLLTTNGSYCVEFEKKLIAFFWLLLIPGKTMIG